MSSISENCFLPTNLTSQASSASLECVAHATDNELLALQQQLNDLSAGVDIFFLVVSSIIMFTMQAGFAMLCAGSVRKKNVQNTMMKNILDACGSAIAFFCCGYAFAYGGTNGLITKNDFGATSKATFIGNENFFLYDFDRYSFWIYQYAFAATSTTIVAGTLAERSQMISYFAYSIILSGFVFPVVAHAVWCIDGFLNAYRGNPMFGSGMVDFAGSGVVHVVGGVTSLIATNILGPRRDRFHDEQFLVKLPVGPDEVTTHRLF